MNSPLALINREIHLPFADFKLECGTFSVGRSSACDFTLHEASISRQHAILEISDTQVLIRDLTSRNGTYIEGRSITNGFVRPGQEIRFGQVRFLLVDLNRYLPQESSEIQTIDLKNEQPALSGPTATRSVLTRAQMKVLSCLMEGKTEKESGYQLGISHHTVHNHIREIYSHFSVHSRSELMAKFIQFNPGPGTNPDLPMPETP